MTLPRQAIVKMLRRAGMEELAKLSARERELVTLVAQSMPG
jgi:DNA-binding CsgD family transcriptional regulator